MLSLLMRDCYAQTKCIRRLVNQLVDDLGDLSIYPTLDKPTRAFFENTNSSMEKMEYDLNAMQKQLEALSNDFEGK
jgi:hypothetical protein